MEAHKKQYTALISQNIVIFNFLISEHFILSFFSLVSAKSTSTLDPFASNKDFSTEFELSYNNNAFLLFSSFSAALSIPHITKAAPRPPH